MEHLAYRHLQWLILSLGGGIMLVLFICLTYLAGWRPRGGEGQEAPASHKTLKFMPWILVVIYVIIIIHYFAGPLLWRYWPEQW